MLWLGEVLPLSWGLNDKGAPILEKDWSAEGTASAKTHKVSVCPAGILASPMCWRLPSIRPVLSGSFRVFSAFSKPSSPWMTGNERRPNGGADYWWTIPAEDTFLWRGHHVAGVWDSNKRGSMFSALHGMYFLFAVIPLSLVHPSAPALFCSPPPPQPRPWEDLDYGAFSFCNAHHPSGLCVIWSSFCPSFRDFSLVGSLSPQLNHLRSGPSYPLPCVGICQLYLMMTIFWHHE